MSVGGALIRLLVRCYPPAVRAHVGDELTRESTGVGIGLSLVYGIVENHGGAIRAVNREPTGTSFFIELPLSHDTGPA